MRAVITFVCIMLLCKAAWAQQSVSGRITDASDGTPIAGASVFAANTTIGTATDLSGNYSFIIPGRGTFEIVVSHVGYQSVSHKIEMPQNAHRYSVALEINELEEVSVIAARTYGNSDVALFWQKILGERPSKNGMQVLNAEKVYFYKNDTMLKASCKEPLEIINHHTGYRISYVLQSFQHDYRSNETTFYGKPFFEELVSQNNRQRNNWEKKRQEVYAVSLNHFMRALYRGQIHEEDFFVIDPFVFENVYIPPSGNASTLQAEISNKLITDEYTLRQQERLEKMRASVAERYRQDQITYLLSDYRKMIETTPSATLEMVSDYVISSLAQNTAKPGQNFVHVNFEDSLILVCISKPVTDLKGKTTTYPVMVGLPPQQLTLFSDGSYAGILKMQEFRGNSILLSTLSSSLPVEYAETIQNSSNNIAGVSLTPLLLERAEENIATQLKIWPQEKLHLHTDRDIYVTGEKIWFKAYVTDAASHLNTTNSNYVYAELISPVDTLVSRVMILQEEGMFHGYMPVPANVPEGDYTLRAYTRYMENLGDDYFFKKNIRISPTPTLPEREGVRNVTGRSTERANNAPLSGELEGAFFDVTFFPEGGNLPEGVVHKVAFKALNRNGYPEAITGYLIDESGIESTPIQTIHAGMGVFSYRPEAGKRYRLKCNNGNGVEKVFELPQSNPRARSLAISILSEGINVGIQKSVDAPDIPCYLLVHCRGNVLFFSEMDDQRTVSFDKEELPAGVIQIVLFDEQMNPLSERLVFSQNEATVPVDFHTDKNEYKIRDRIVATLSFPDSLTPSLLGRAGEGLSAHFSIAVTDDKDVAVDESTTILSSLLLSSELKGYIENPAYYLHDPVAMDLLMMTHGWRRYNIPEVVQGCPETPKIPFQQYQTISGRVNTTTIFNRPVPDSEIIIAIERGGYGVMSTDENGLFIVQELAFPDSTNFFLQALNKKGNDNVKLTVNLESFPGLVYAPKTPFSKQNTRNIETKDESDANTFLSKTAQRAKYEEELWTIQLQEVEVTAPVIKKRELRDDFYLNGSADYTMRREQIDEWKFPFIKNYLEMVPGLSVELNDDGYFNYYLLPRSLFPPAKIYLNGIETDTKEIHTLTQYDIESIDIIRYASILGVRGTGGVISITTRREGAPEPEKLNHIVYTPLGYQQPVAFYAPKYETLEALQSPIPDLRTTIFWKPDVVISEEGEASFEFYSSDFSTTYSVVIEGLTADGKIVRQVEKITVSY